jgi:hypothetical protein
MISPSGSGWLSSRISRQTDASTIHVVLFSVRGWVDTRIIERREGLSQWKISMTPLRVETANFRLLSHCLNQVCHRVVPTKYTLSVDHILRLSTISFVVMQNNFASLSTLDSFLKNYPSAILLVFCTASNYSDHWHFPASFAHCPGSLPFCLPTLRLLCWPKCKRIVSESFLLFYCSFESPSPTENLMGGLNPSRKQTGGTFEMDVTRRAAACSGLSVGILPIYGHPSSPF